MRHPAQEMVQVRTSVQCGRGREQREAGLETQGVAGLTQQAWGSAVGPASRVGALNSPKGGMLY